MAGGWTPVARGKSVMADSLPSRHRLVVAPKRALDVRPIDSPIVRPIDRPILHLRPVR